MAVQPVYTGAIETERMEETIMIKSSKQAAAVQKRRIKAGKRGYSKAVRRYFLRIDSFNYRANMSDMPVSWGQASGSNS